MHEAARHGQSFMETISATLEEQLAAAESARDGALRELDSLRTRIAAADAIHRRTHERDREHQKTLDALNAAELNLKAARNSEAQANTRAAASEAALLRSQVPAGMDPEIVPALQKQLGEARRLEAAAVAEAADLRTKLAAAREQVTAVASDEALAAVRDDAGKARAEAAAIIAQNGLLRRELDTAKARIAQLEAASLTLHAKMSGPPPELAEARAEIEKARQATRSAEGNAAKLRRDLADFQTRFKAIETTLAATRSASAANIAAGAELAAARKQADQLRSELRAVCEENRRIKEERTQRPPRQREERKPENRKPEAPAERIAPATELAFPGGDAPESQAVSEAITPE